MNLIARWELERLSREGLLPENNIKKPSLLPTDATDNVVLKHAREVLGFKNGAEYRYLRGWRTIENRRNYAK